jgi:hypothetical protein
LNWKTSEGIEEEENKVVRGLGTRNTDTVTLFSKEGGSHGSKEGSEEDFQEGCEEG